MGLPLTNPEMWGWAKITTPSSLYKLYALFVDSRQNIQKNVKIQKKSWTSKYPNPVNFFYYFNNFHFIYGQKNIYFQVEILNNEILKKLRVIFLKEHIIF